MREPREGRAVTSGSRDDSPRRLSKNDRDCRRTRVALSTAGHSDQEGPVEVAEKPDGIYLHLTKVKETTREEPVAAPAAGSTVLFISAWAVGRGPEELQDVLIRGFLHTLNQVSPLPDAIIFINTGVRLSVEDSPVLEDLQALEEQGVEILICGTCLDYFGLTEKVAVGAISNMYTIAETLLGAGKVVAL